jgi:BirA family biotin operon repressor/biotin-[acetyl-CoA-carboxylase] ligase
MLTFESLQARLPVEAWGGEIEFHTRLKSTNDRAKYLAERGAPHGTLVVADEQTAGKGRGDHRWFTPPQSAVALSLVIRPAKTEQAYLGALNALGALAVVEALEKLGLEAQIKWPNDVLLDGRKSGGILTEITWQAEIVEYAIVGIGVNVSPDSVPPPQELQWPATCVEAVLAGRVERVDFLVDIVQGVAKWYPRLGTPEVVSAWEQQLAFKGECVRLQNDSQVIQGRVLGLDPNGQLVLETEDGVRQVKSGAWQFSRVDTPGI